MKFYTPHQTLSNRLSYYMTKSRESRIKDTTASRCTRTSKKHINVAFVITIFLSLLSLRHHPRLDQDEETPTAPDLQIAKNIDPSTTPSKHKTRAVIHMGPHKTATTTIQQYSKIFKHELQKDGYDMPWNVKMMSEGGSFNPYLVKQHNFATCFVTNTKGADPCYPDLERYGLEIADKKRNLFVSAETFSIIDIEGIKKLKSYLSHWDEVTIIVYYRRYYDWLVSTYNEINKQRSLSSRESIFDFFARPEENQWHYTISLIKRLNTQFNSTNIVVRNMHDDAQGDITVSFYCEAMPNAANTCHATTIRSRENRNKSENYNIGQNLPYADLALGAINAGLITLDGGGIKETEFITRLIRNHQEQTLNLKSSDFQRTCPDSSVLEAIWNVSLAAETELYPDSDESNLRDEFESYATTKLCMVDVDKVLQEKTWQSFFKSLQKTLTFLSPKSRR